MAKRKSSVPKFMKYSGSIKGPVDLSSRRISEAKITDEKAEVKPLKKPLRRQA
jgi:hypothetical protein